MNKIIHIAKPNINEEEINEVIKVLRSGELAQGRWVEKFENKFAKYIGTKFAIAVSNGTDALFLALLSLGIEAGDEVITTPFTFIASSNSILYTGAKPVFVDINPDTFNIDPNLIEEKITVKTKAIMPVHLFGLSADMDRISKIAKKHNLAVIEDAAQSHGAKIGNRCTGNLGDIATFSFYSTKNITTGEGGMITTNNKKLAIKIRMLRNHGMQKKYHHEILGFNSRMTNFQAAIGLHQLEKLDQFNKKRIENAKFLTDRLSKIRQIQTPYVPANFTHVFHQYTIIIKEGASVREKLMEFLDKNGVSSMIYYPIPIHKQKFMKKKYNNQKLINAEKSTRQVLSIPVHQSITKEELDKITQLFEIFFNKKTI